METHPLLSLMQGGEVLWAAGSTAAQHSSAGDGPPPATSTGGAACGNRREPFLMCFRPASICLSSGRFEGGTSPQQMSMLNSWGVMGKNMFFSSLFAGSCPIASSLQSLVGD